jgi:hypothetical protein
MNTIWINAQVFRIGQLLGDEEKSTSGVTSERTDKSGERPLQFVTAKGWYSQHTDITLEAKKKRRRPVGTYRATGRMVPARWSALGLSLLYTI